MTDLIIKQYESADPLYCQACSLRERLLREPLGMRLREVDVQYDGHPNMMHFAALVGGQLIATVSFWIKMPGAELRQMCVDSTAQGLNVGASIIAHAEEELKRYGVSMIRAHARVSVVGFYQKSGFFDVSQHEEHLGIPHVWVEKYL